MDFKRRAGGCDREEVLPARPVRAIFANEDRLEVKERLLRLDDEFGRAGGGHGLSFDGSVPVVLRGQNDASIFGRINDANGLRL